MVVARGAEPSVNGGPTAPRRVTGRRRPLPNGRAVVGGLLVAAAGVGTYAAWAAADDAPSTTYAVAARDLPVGHVIGSGDVELVAVDAPPSVAARAFAEGDTSLLVGQLTVAPLAEGDLVQRSAVVVPEDADRARQFSFAIDASAALAGTLQQGERVDVLVTLGDGDDAATEVVAEGATVAQLRGDPDEGRLVVLLSVSDDTDLPALVTAARRGELTLVRTTPGP